MTEIEKQMMALAEQVKTLQKKLDEKEHHVQVLLKQSDYWAKSYDTLLNDFIQFRNDTFKRG